MHYTLSYVDNKGRKLASRSEAIWFSIFFDGKHKKQVVTTLKIARGLHQYNITEYPYKDNHTHQTIHHTFIIVLYLILDVQSSLWLFHGM